MTNLSIDLCVVSKGYTTIKSGNMNGACTVRCFVRVLRGLGTHTRIEVMFPKNGIFTIGKIFVGTTELSYGGLPVLGMMVERIENGLCFFGDVSIPARKFKGLVDRLLAQLDVWVDFNGYHSCGANYADHVCLVEFRHYDFLYGRECSIYSATDNFTLSELARRTECERVTTNYALVLPGKAEDYVNSDLLGRDDYDPTVYVGKSGSLYSFVFNLGL